MTASAQQFRSISLPDTVPPSYPCESINKVVSQEVLPTLTKAERRSAYVELSQALYAIQGEMQLAINRDSAPESWLSHKPMDHRWLSRAKRLRATLGELLALIREYERDLEPRAIEVEAITKRRALTRRLRRQQCLIDAFTGLVAAEFGEEKLSDLLRRAGVLADKWVEVDQETKPGVIRRAMQY